MKINAEYVFRVLFSLNPSFHNSTIPLFSAFGGWAKRTNLSQLRCELIQKIIDLKGGIEYGAVFAEGGENDKLVCSKPWVEVLNQI